MTRAHCFQQRQSRLNRLFGAENEFSPDLLKDSFNCPDLARHGDHPVFTRGERMENAGGAVALWEPRRYISGSKFP
jgi:hypothetical protein